MMSRRTVLATSDISTKVAADDLHLSSLLSPMMKNIEMQAMMKVWLFVHLPLSFALLAALTAHIVAVFYYW